MQRLHRVIHLLHRCIELLRPMCRQSALYAVQGFLNVADRGSCVERLRRMGHCRLHIHQHTLDAPAAHARAEELRGEIGDLVCLIEDDGIGGSENVTESILLQRQVGQQEVVIDDDNVRVERLAPRNSNMTTRELRAVLTETVLTRRGHARPDRM